MGPGMGSVTDDGVKLVLKPAVVGIVTLAVLLPWTAGLVCDVAIAVSSSHRSWQN